MAVKCSLNNNIMYETILKILTIVLYMGGAILSVIVFYYSLIAFLKVCQIVTKGIKSWIKD